MDVVSKQYLQHRRMVWIFRRRVPPHLQGIIGQTEWKESLKTGDLRSALARRNQLAAQTEMQIAAAEAELARKSSPPLTPVEAASLANEWLGSWIQLDAEMRLARGAEWSEGVDLALEVTASEHREALATGDWHDMREEAEKLLRRGGRWYPSGDGSLRVLAGELLKARVRGDDLLALRQGGAVVEAPASQPAAAGGSSMAVETLIAKFREAQVAERGLTLTQKKYGHIFSALTEILGGGRRIAEVTREDGRAVKSLLQRVPLYAGRRYPKLTLMDAAEAAARDGAPVLSPGTVRTYLQNLAAVFNFAVKEQWLSQSPVEGLVPDRMPTVRRRGFQEDELAALFAGLPSRAATRPGRFWVPALSLYTGARAGELCQLLVADVIEEGGRLFLDLSLFDAQGRLNPDKRLKTAASERVVPIHPDLVAAGFAEFLERRQASGDERLFPEFRQGPNGGFSHDLSKWFGRYLSSIGLTSPSLVFHSFRHGFSDAGRRAGLAPETVDALGGWATAGQRARYGNRMERARDIDRIGYWGFCLPSSRPG